MTIDPDAISPKPARGDARSATGGPPRNRLLDDLAEAMRAAAEVARDESAASLAADARRRLDDVRARSVAEAGRLRRAAAEDVAAVRVWSKAEMARVRQESESRISTRKARLTLELERHEAAVTGEIERIGRIVAEFEQETARFFEPLLAEEDPARIAALARNLPERPSLEQIDGLSHVGFSSLQTPPPRASGPDVAVPDVGDLPGAPQPDDAVAVEDNAARGETGAGVTDDAAPAETGGEAAATADAEPAIFASTETEEGLSRDGAALAEAEAASIAAETAADAIVAEAEADGAIVAEGSIDDLGFPRPGTLEARLGRLWQTPADGWPNDGTATMETRLLIDGLVSVGSVAALTGKLRRIAGVRSVRVASGATDGFVFTVVHAPRVELAAAVSSAEEFRARVTEARDGVLAMTLDDPAVAATPGVPARR